MEEGDMRVRSRCSGHAPNKQSRILQWETIKVGVALILACTLMALNVLADDKVQQEPSGLLMIPIDKNNNQPVEAETLSTEIEVIVTGMIVRTKVRQKFENKSKDWMEGVYKFPLPDNASVDGMILKIGERIIVSEIKEKSEASRIYTEAAAAGKKTALLDQLRPNMFSTRIANIEPGGKLSVEITFQTLAEQVGSGFTWRMPQAITPRYESEFLSSVDDSDGPLTPEEDYTETGPGNLTSFRILMKNMKDLEKVDSPSHKLDIDKRESKNNWITLSEGQKPADRDFILNWKFASGEKLKTYIFKETIEDTDYYLGIIQPPLQDSESIVTPRDITFIIDVSGSMHGIAMEQARSALLQGLIRLRAQDSFDIIAFNNSSWRLFGRSQIASDTNIIRARKFVSSLEAEGGTEMYPALASALSGAADDTKLRQILFLTDGAISDEQKMFDLVGTQLNEARLFTVGLGSAPNGWFMRKAAEIGRGVHIHIDNLETSGLQLSALFNDMAYPWAQNIQYTGMNKSETYPKVIPDLFGSRPIIFTFRQPTGLSVGEISAELSNGDVWKQVLYNDYSANDAAISKYWARHKVEGLMDARRQGMSEVIVKAGILKTALKHQIMSPYTSFVAVDKTPVRVQEDFLRKAKVQSNLPKGVSWTKVHGPKTASPLYWHFLLGLGLLVLALLVARRQNLFSSR